MALLIAHGPLRGLWTLRVPLPCLPTETPPERRRRALDDIPPEVGPLAIWTLAAQRPEPVASNQATFLVHPLAI